jgi:DNA invertase Pin-like site-specific DNA recombinase
VTAAALYARISADHTGEALGVARQLEDARALAARKGWTVALELTDNDLSAYSGKRRPAYERLLSALEAGEVDAVVAWHPDRLHRSPRELERFIDLVERAGASVATVTAGELDLATPTGRMVARIVGAVARQESEHKAARIARKHLQSAQAGKPHGGGERAYGYTPDGLELVPEEAERIREGAARILAGDSLRGVCADWNRAGVTSSAGTPWVPSSLKRLLTSARVAGLRELRGESWPAVWPAILEPRTMERLRAVLRDPARRSTTKRARSYLLSGLLVCGKCGHQLHARRRKREVAAEDGSPVHVRGYVCLRGPGFDGCGGLRVSADPLEELVAGAVVAALDSPELADAVARGETNAPGDAILAAIAADETALLELADDLAADRVTVAGYRVADRIIRDRLEARRRELANVAGPAPAIAGVAAERWPELGLDRRRAIIAAVLEPIAIGPAVRGRTAFDPSRVTLRWRV